MRAENIRSIPQNKILRRFDKMKKLLVSISVALVIVLCSFMTACLEKPSTDKFRDLDTAEEVYAFSAASAGMIISAMENDVPAINSSIYTVGENDATPVNPETPPVNPEIPPETQENPAAAEFRELDKYMSLVESLLTDDSFGIRETQSDKPEYEHKTVISYKDFNGDDVSYVMYYNKILIESERDDDDDDDDDKHEIDNEIEETFSIEGIMLIGENQYPIRGEREDESEGDESESETEFIVELGGNSYIKVEHSVEKEKGETEQEYSYSLFENGRLKERSAFSYEQERDETELKMNVVKDGNSTTLYFEKEVRGNRDVIVLRIKQNGVGKSYLVESSVENGQTVYKYTPINDVEDDD